MSVNSLCTILKLMTGALLWSSDETRAKLTFTVDCFSYFIFLKFSLFICYVTDLKSFWSLYTWYIFTAACGLTHMPHTLWPHSPHTFPWQISIRPHFTTYRYRTQTQTMCLQRGRSRFHRELGARWDLKCSQCGKLWRMREREWE